MLPLPRVGGALSDALKGSIAGTGARVKRRVQSRRRWTSVGNLFIVRSGSAETQCILILMTTSS